MKAINIGFIACILFIIISLVVSSVKLFLLSFLVMALLFVMSTTEDHNHSNTNEDYNE